VGVFFLNTVYTLNLVQDARMASPSRNRFKDHGASVPNITILPLTQSKSFGDISS